MGLAVTFKWRGLVSFVVESRGINYKFGSGIKSSSVFGFHFSKGPSF